MFGYACDETADLMPLPIWTAHRLAERLAEVRKSGQVPYLRPDGKTQVTYEYEDGRAVALKTVLISTQHQDGVDRDTVIRPDLIEQVIRPTIPEQFADDDYEVWINPTGTFVLGGPHADCGLTGRKIIVDTYGGMGRHGGGAFSGKDPSKVDRSGCVRRPLGRQARRGQWRGDALRGAGRLRHRRRPPDEHPRRDVRHQHGRRGRHREGRPRGVRPASGGHPPRPRPEAPDLPRHRRVRPLRPRRCPASRGSTPPSSTTSRPPPASEPRGRPDAAMSRRRAVRVIPDVTGLDKEFDYLVPDGLDAPVGTRVRVPLHGRRVAGWVVAADPSDAAVDVARLRPLAAVSSRGPAPELIELARWAAVRWAAARLRPFLVTASPPTNVARAPGAAPHRARAEPDPRRGRPRCWPPAAGCCGCRRPTTSCPCCWPRSRSARCWSIVAGRRPGRACWRRGCGGPGSTVALHAAGVGGGGRRRRRRDRGSRRGVGAVPRPRRRGRRRRARRGPAGGAQPDVARPRRRRGAGPAGRGRRCCWCRRARPSTGWLPSATGWCGRRSTRSEPAGRSSSSSTAAATSRGRRRS